MIEINPLLLLDGYKISHIFQYPPDTEIVYSNLTPRGSRTEHNKVVAFGFQYFVKDYLVRQFNKNFFQRNKKEVMDEYKYRIENYIGPLPSYAHIEALYDLQYLPLLIKAVPEGTRVPIRVPMLTIRNTKPEFFWLTNMIETLMSNILWGPCTSATTAFGYRQVFEEYADITGADKEFIKWQGHDFSFRGLTGIENAQLSGAAHLLSFTGTDTVPAIDFLEEFYGANIANLIGGSVPATEHSVMCMGEQTNELTTFNSLMNIYATGILSVVSDTSDLWHVLEYILPTLKREILARDGKLVIRPDSGDPVKIINGDPASYREDIRKGVIEVLWDTFGGTTNSKGYKTLDPHIGVIYGDSISPDRQKQILAGLEQKGFASDNIVLGIGSYTYNYVTRDTYEFAIKSTFGRTTSKGDTAISKDPVTDSGMKKSAVGLLCVRVTNKGELWVQENCTWEEEGEGELKRIFEDGFVYNQTTLQEIRERIEMEL